MLLLLKESTFLDNRKKPLLQSYRVSKVLHTIKKITTRIIPLLALRLLMHSPVYARADKPKLILQITIDQLRGDLPARYYDRLGKGGFKYLLDKGTVYSDAHHSHANTETIVGHTTLATGAPPAIHGMVGNIWFDRSSQKTTYNIEDKRYKLLSQNADVDDATEIDPTQKAASSDGRSPSAILTTTFADELSSHTANKAKVIGISVKDRGAVAMAGHSGKAYWFSKASSEFVSSTYYHPQYPQWVNNWNAKKYAKRYSGGAWALMHKPQSYLFADRDDQAWEVDLAGFGRVFPHPFGTTENNKYFSTLLTLSPAADELTLSFAQAAIVGEKLGDDKITDYLSISFSATDYIGHFFGPSSLEAEDNILRLDNTLAKLFQFIDKEVGLKNTLIVLSADHGSPEAPGYLQSMNIPTGYISPDKWDTQPAIKRIKDKFGISGKLIETYNHPYVYLSNEIVNNEKYNIAKLEQAIVSELKRFKGVHTAVASTALARGELANTPLNTAIINNYHPQRSGNVYLVFKPGWFINDLDGLSAATVHGSPWHYDTFVPIIFAGYNIKPKTIARRVETVDLAPTLSNFVSIQAPSGSTGKVLVEVLEQR